MRWSSRIDAIRALKNRYADILKVLSRIVLTSKENKERSEASGLKKTIETFDFRMHCCIRERILTSLHTVSQKFQTINNDLSISVRLLSVARDDLLYLRGSWENILLSANAISSRGVKPLFAAKCQRHTKKFHDELSRNNRLTDPEHAFKV